MILCSWPAERTVPDPVGLAPRPTIDPPQARRPARSRGCGCPGRTVRVRTVRVRTVLGLPTSRVPDRVRRPAMTPCSAGPERTAPGHTARRHRTAPWHRTARCPADLGSRPGPVPDRVRRPAMTPCSVGPDRKVLGLPSGRAPGQAPRPAMTRYPASPGPPPVRRLAMIRGPWGPGRTGRVRWLARIPRSVGPDRAAQVPRSSPGPVPARWPARSRRCGCPGRTVPAPPRSHRAARIPWPATGASLGDRDRTVRGPVPSLARLRPRLPARQPAGSSRTAPEDIGSGRRPNRTGQDRTGRGRTGRGRTGLARTPLARTRWGQRRVAPTRTTPARAMAVRAQVASGPAGLMADHGPAVPGRAAPEQTAPEQTAADRTGRSTAAKTARTRAPARPGRRSSAPGPSRAPGPAVSALAAADPVVARLAVPAGPGGYAAVQRIPASVHTRPDHFAPPPARMTFRLTQSETLLPGCARRHETRPAPVEPRVRSP
jgi:hypothetical protein